MFNIWKEGFNARMNGQSRNSNPYAEGSYEYYNWNNGWDYANRRVSYQETNPR